MVEVGSQSSLRSGLRWLAAGLALALVSFPALLALSGGIDPAYACLASAVALMLVAALFAWFTVRIGELRREHQSLVSRHAESDARERYLVGLATLCAGTAHEISTPLMTMALVLGELRSGKSPPADWARRIDTLWEQVEMCKRSLSTMTLTTNVERFGKLHLVPAKQLLHEVCDRFRQLRPAVAFRERRPRIGDSIVLESDETLSQALLNFLNNAAHASPTVELRAAQRGDSLVIQILDRGPGFPPELRERISKGSITTKPPGRGSGAGVLIAQAVVGRLGGSVQIVGRTGGGTCVQIELPLSRSNEGKSHEYREQRIASG